MEKILIIGAFDRYNYGDLLFPIIIEKQLKTYGIPFEYRFFGLVESDLSEEGGKPTESLKAFYEQCNGTGQKVNIIVAGGEALGVTWYSLLAALSKPYQKIHRYHPKISKLVDLNRIARFFLKGQTILPFVFTKSDFKSANSVILNSLGGSGLQRMHFEKYPFLQEKLNKADYLAVRDKTTASNLEQNGVPARLFPDSAILMSEFFPVEELEKKVTKPVKAYAREHKGNYVFFQANRKTTRGQETTIASQLDAIHQESGVELCLCPIGKALDHDDHITLSAVRGILKSPSTYFDADHIWDIMYLIANAQIYIGTSLHGAITALSYAVPHVGLKVEKLHAYLHTWGVSANDFAVDFNQMNEQYKTATAIPQEAYKKARALQIAEMKTGFGEMIKKITRT